MPPWGDNKSVSQLEVALTAQKRILLLHGQDARHGPFDFDQEVKAAPVWLQELIEAHESLPWQRRGYLRAAMLEQLTTAAGFAPLEEVAEAAGDDGQDS